MDKVIMCGTDAHDATLVSMVGVGKEEPEIMQHGNTRAGRKKLFSDLKELAKANGTKKIHLTYEASGLGYGLYDDCLDAGIECSVLAPSKIRRGNNEKKRKTDIRDAKALFETLRGHILGGNELPEVWVPSPELRDDRELVRARAEMSEKGTAVRAQIQCLLKRSAVKKGKDVGKAWSASYWKWLTGLELPHGAQTSLESLIRQLNFLGEELMDLDERLKELSCTDRYALMAEELLRLKGVGIVTTMTFLTEMGDLTRFKNRKQIGAYLGLVPSSDESGEKNDRKGHITHEGPWRVRKVLCQAAWCRVRLDPGEQLVYQRIVDKNPKHKKIALVAAMRRLGVLMWHIAKDAQQHTELQHDAA